MNRLLNFLLAFPVFSIIIKKKNTTEEKQIDLCHSRQGENREDASLVIH